MNEINLLIKGFIVGIAKIIPGVSGSLVALNLGIYNKAIKAISNFFKDVKSNLHFLLNVGTGVLLAIIFGSKIINYLLTKNYYFTMIIFIGLLIGSNIKTFKESSTPKQKLYMLIIFLLMFSLFFIKTNINYTYKNNLLNNVYVIILGFIDAATMIIPAISGTIIFMLMGSYNFILNMFGNVIDNFNVMILFSIGLFIGIIIVTKIMDKLFDTKQEIIFSIINGFFLSSILYLCIEIFKHINNLYEILLSIPLLYISYKISYKLNK